MICNTPINHNTTISSGAICAERTATSKPSRLGSVLARVLAQQVEPTPNEKPLYTSDYLARLNVSRVGKAFHILTSKGELLRRGYVIDDSKHAYTVQFIDPFTCLPRKTQRFVKSATAKWQWFDGVEESNVEYDRKLNTGREETPSPRFVWTDGSLEQIYYQESN
jgi:hypothetical protein